MMMPTTLDELVLTDTQAADARYLRLSEVPRTLRRQGVSASYQVLYRRLVDGELPGWRTSTGRWLVDRADLPLYAKVLANLP